MNSCCCFFFFFFVFVVFLLSIPFIWSIKFNAILILILYINFVKNFCAQFLLIDLNVLHFRGNNSSLRVLVHYFSETTLAKVPTTPLLLKTKDNFFSLTLQLLKTYCLVTTSALQSAECLAYGGQLP